MPKERRKRSGGHDQSVRLSKRQFVTDGGVEQVEIGEQADVPAAEVLSAISELPGKPVLKKKEKQQLKHEAFLERLESSHTPYSKSHARRLKRKAKEELAHGLQDVALALPSLENENEPSDLDSDTMPAVTNAPSAKKSRPKHGQIGEGKGVPLSKNERRKVLKTEKLRQPLLVSTPEFASNPFQAIRIHSQNTLVKHQKQ